MKWRCVYCKPKSCEKVKFYLEKAGLEVFYPIIEEKRRVNKKPVYIYKELFPNYIFVRFDLKNYRLVKYTMGVSKIISNRNNEPAVVPDKIIDSIKAQMVNDYVKLKKHFKKGDSVIITDGPFKEMEAIFLENIKPNERVLILLKAINNEIKVEIDACMLQNS